MGVEVEFGSIVVVVVVVSVPKCFDKKLPI